MADNIQKVNLIDIDLNKSMIHRGWLNHSIGKADNKADAFGIRVYRDGSAVSLSGASVQGFFRNAEGTNIAITSGNSISGNTATVVLPQACYNVEGKFTLAIKLIASGITGTMRIVDGMVDNTNTGSAVAPTGTVPTYQEILAVYDQMVAATDDVNRMMGNIAPTYSENEVYDVGTYCFYNGSLYRCKTEIVTPETWTSTHWKKVALGPDVADVANSIREDIAPTYSESEVYAVGDYRYYKGVLYRCIKKITTPKSWSSTNWEEAVLGTEVDAKVNDLKSALKNTTGNELLDGWSENHKYIITNGTTADINTPATTQSDVHYMVIPCLKGDQFTITCTGGNASRAYAFVSSDGTILESASANATLTNRTVTAPENAKKLVVNDTSLAGAVYYGKYIRAIINDLDLELQQTKIALNNRIDLEVLKNLGEKKIYNFVDLSEATWERKLVSTQGDVTDNYTKAILSSEITIPEGVRLIRYTGEEYNYAGAGYTSYICFYNSTGTFISRVGIFTSGTYTDAIIPANATKYRVLLAVSSSETSTVTLDQANNVRIEYQNILDELTDTTSEEKERIDAIESDVHVDVTKSETDFSWSQGGISTEGTATGVNNFIRTPFLKRPETNIIKYVGEIKDSEGVGYDVFIAQYDSEYNFIPNSRFLFISVPAQLDQNCRYVRYSFGYPSSAGKTIPTSGASDFAIQYQTSRVDIIEERIDAIENDVHVDVTKSGTDFSWSQGGISTEGTATGVNNFIRTPFLKRPETNIIKYVGEIKDSEDIGYNAFIAQYDSEYNFIPNSRFLFISVPAQLDQNCRYVRYSFGYPSSAGKTIQTSGASDFAFQYQTSRVDIIEEEMEKYADETEQIQNKVNLPIEDKNGNRGQTLYTFGDGTTYWGDPVVPPESELTEIIGNWLEEHPQVLGNESNRAYQNVYAMKDDRTITAGMVCRTFGFRTPGDDGAGQYIISSTGTANGKNVIELGNGLFATLVIGKIINIKSLGAYGDGTHDDSETMVHAVSLLSDGKAVFFPSGIYIHGDGEMGENGTGNSYTPTGSSNSYYHDSEHPVDIGRDIRLKISNLNNIAIYGEQGSIIRSNAGNGECRNNEIFSFTNCNGVLLKNLVIDGNRENRGLYLTDADYGGYNQRGNIRIIGCNRVIIDNVQSVNSGMDGAYIGVSNIENVKIKSTNVYISRSNFENAHRNGLSIAGCEYVYVNEVITSDAGKSGESYGGTNPKACVDIEADYISQPNNCIFISGMKALGASGTYSIWVSAHASNVYIEKTTIDKDTYTSGTDTSNINVSTIDLS